MIFWKINMQSIRAASVSIYNFWYVCARGSTTPPGPLTGTPTSLAANHFSLPGSLMAGMEGGESALCVHFTLILCLYIALYTKHSVCFFLSRSLHLHCSFLSITAPSVFSPHVSAFLPIFAYFEFHYDFHHYVNLMQPYIKAYIHTHTHKMWLV